MLGLIVLVILVLLVIFAIGMYNGLVRLKVQCDNAWADIDVQLKRRYDLIPNLVETVKGYAGHEKGTLEAVINARNRAMTAAGPADKAAAENMLSGALKAFSLFLRLIRNSVPSRALPLSKTPCPKSKTTCKTPGAITTRWFATSTPKSCSSPPTSLRECWASSSASSSKFHPPPSAKLPKSASAIQRRRRPESRRPVPCQLVTNRPGGGTPSWPCFFCFFSSPLPFPPETDAF